MHVQSPSTTDCDVVAKSLVAVHPFLKQAICIMCKLKLRSVLLKFIFVLLPNVAFLEDVYIYKGTKYQSSFQEYSFCKASQAGQVS